MSVRYYYGPDSADIGVQGRTDCGLVAQGLDVLQVAYTHGVFATEWERVMLRSERNEGGAVTEYVFDDNTERRMVTEGLRRVSAAAHSEGSLRARRRGRRARELAGRIMTAEYE